MKKLLVPLALVFTLLTATAAQAVTAELWMRHSGSWSTPPADYPCLHFRPRITSLQVNAQYHFHMTYDDVTGVFHVTNAVGGPTTYAITAYPGGAAIGTGAAAVDDTITIPPPAVGSGTIFYLTNPFTLTRTSGRQVAMEATIKFGVAELAPDHPYIDPPHFAGISCAP